MDIVQQVSQRRVIRLGVPHQDRGADHEHVGFRREGVDALRANDTLPELSHRKEDARELRIARVCETGVGARRGWPARRRRRNRWRLRDTERGQPLNQVRTAVRRTAEFNVLFSDLTIEPAAGGERQEPRAS